MKIEFEMCCHDLFLELKYSPHVRFSLEDIISEEKARIELSLFIDSFEISYCPFCGKKIDLKVVM